jgi:murein DD-endopeptidase MepM/ murein hydrolase activator NlpD
VPPRVPPTSPPLTIHDAPGDYPTPRETREQAAQAQADADEAAAAARAEAEAAARASAARVAAFMAAQADFTKASAAYDDAKLTYASVKALYDEAVARATLVHGMATDAAESAARAGRVVATITRAMAQQRSGTAAVDAFLDGSGSGLLDRLGTLDKLSHLSGSLPAIKERSVVEQQRADALLEKDRVAQEAVLAVPLDQARSGMEAAKAGFDAAKARLDSLRRASTAGVLGMSPLPAHKPDTGQLSAQGWVLPAVGAITDRFGPRPDKPLPDVGDYHYGTDIGASCDAGVYAATSGTVVSAGTLGTYGNWILIDHGNGVQTGYAHLATGETLVSVGDTVIGGQVIAGVGSTGASTGCHLHFEVRIDGSRVDPQPFLAKRGVVLGR